MKDENKKLSYFQYCNVNDLRGWVLSQKLPIKISEWIEHTS